MKYVYLAVLMICAFLAKWAGFHTVELCLWGAYVMIWLQWIIEDAVADGTERGIRAARD